MHVISVQWKQRVNFRFFMVELYRDFQECEGEGKMKLGLKVKLVCHVERDLFVLLTFCPKFCFSHFTREIPPVKPVAAENKH